MYDLYAMAHTASYKKVKAFSESDLEHPENFTNISSHDKLVKYRDHGKARKGEDFNPSEGPIDPELVMIAGNGRPHGSIAIGDGLIRCPSTLRQIKARQTSSCPEITRRPRPVELAIEVSLMDSTIFPHYVVRWNQYDYIANNELCCRLLFRKRERQCRRLWRRRIRRLGSWRRGRLHWWRRRGHEMKRLPGPYTSSSW